MEQKTLLAFVLSIAVLLLWSFFFTPEAPRHNTEPLAPISTPEPGKVVLPSPLAANAAPSMPAKSWEIDTPFYQLNIASAGARIASFKLHQYHGGISTATSALDLVTTQASGYLPGAVELLQHPQWDLPSLSYTSTIPQKLQLTAATQQNLTFNAEIPRQLKISKSFVLDPTSYALNMSVRLKNLAPATLKDQVAISFYCQPLSAGTQEQTYNKFQLTVFSSGSLQTNDFKDLSKKSLSYSLPLSWAGFANNYFLQALVPTETGGYQVVPRLIDETSGLVQLVYVSEALSWLPGEEKTIDLKLYFGPKDLKHLKVLGAHLEAAVDYGWFDFLAKPLLYALNWLYKYTHNYGIAIIVITVLIKILFWPLTHKSYKSMQAMKKLQPQMAKIREKYGNDREKLNSELMGLYRTYKVNPLGGCLPMILQIPVFFALYRMLSTSVDLLHQPFIWWINDLTAPDRLAIGFSIPYVGGLPVLTLLMGASMFIQQKMTPSGGDPRQEKMMLLMPVVFTVMFVNFPSGLVLYWLVNNVLSIAQQYWINRAAT